MATKFRTKPVEIEAVQWKGNNLLEILDWAGPVFTDRVVPATGNRNPEFTAAVFDKLHDTWIAVKTGQWIVCGIKGEHYPCDDETFFWKYEEV